MKIPVNPAPPAPPTVFAPAVPITPKPRNDTFPAVTVNTGELGSVSTKMTGEPEKPD